MAVSDWLAKLKNAFTSEPKTTRGPEVIAEAYHDLNDEPGDVSATMGTPEMGVYGSVFNNDIVVEIPLTATKYRSPAPLMFELDGEQIEEFLAVFGLDKIEQIGQVEDEVIDVEWVDGSPQVRWQEYEESTE